MMSSLPWLTQPEAQGGAGGESQALCWGTHTSTHARAHTHTHEHTHTYMHS